MKHKIALLAVSLAVIPALSFAPAYADVISPGIKDTGKLYSEEDANTSYYGTGIGAIQTEASMLRFDIERALQKNRLEEAITKAKKCTQLDPSDPINHILLARALTRKFYAKQGTIDEKLLAEALYEWKLIWFHDADQHEQAEAKANARRLMKIAKALAKEKEFKAKQEMLAREEAKKQMASSGGRHEEVSEEKTSKAASQPPKPTGPVSSQLHQEGANPMNNAELAIRKKRFIIF